MSLKVVIERYMKEDFSTLKDKKIFYENMPLHEAVKNAASAITPEKIMDSHQRRIGKKICVDAAIELLKLELEIKRCNTFEKIFEITEKVKKRTDRLGDLWSYDTALRIGFNKKVYPKEVYVQRGVVKGVKKALNGKCPRGRSLPLGIFPQEIQDMKEPYLVENFLCIWGKDGKKSNC
ncbi:MAG: hypothetical protein AB7P01_17300 [Bacteroidia bacterium]